MPGARGSRGKKVNNESAPPVMGGMSDNEPTKRPSGHWYKSTLAGKIPRRLRKTRRAALLLFGATKAIGTGTLAAGRGGKRVVRATVERSRRGRSERRWMVEDVMASSATDAPDLDRHHRKTFGGKGFYCSPCNTRYASAELLNDHFLLVHMDEEPSAVAVEPLTAERVIHRSPSSGRARVKRMDQPRPIKRHARTARTGQHDYATAVVAKYGKQINATGARVMSSDPIAQRLRSAGKAFAEQKPRGRREMYEQVTGLIAGISALREGVEVYGANLRKPYRDRTELAAELVRPHFAAADVALDEAAAALTRFIATFEDVNALAILVAKGQLANGGDKFLAD